MNKERFVLFIAHGSRESSAGAGFDVLLHSLKKSFAPRPVGGAYLTLNQPSIPEAVEAAIKKGHHDFMVIPLFFFEGSHLKNDIPQILADLKLKHSDLDFQIMPPVASLEGFADWVVKQARQND